MFFTVEKEISCSLYFGLLILCVPVLHGLSGFTSLLLTFWVFKFLIAFMNPSRCLFDISFALTWFWEENIHHPCIVRLMFRIDIHLGATFGRILVLPFIIKHSFSMKYLMYRYITLQPMILGWHPRAILDLLVPFSSGLIIFCYKCLTC